MRKTAAQKREEEEVELRLFQEKARAYAEGKEYARAEMAQQNLGARTEMMRAAADLALANAKLTYALSRILNEKGW